MTRDQNLIMVSKGKRIVFNMADEDLEELFDHIRMNYGCYQGQTFQQIIDESPPVGDAPPDDPIEEVCESSEASE